jgi:hypothetical protein
LSALVGLRVASSAPSINHLLFADDSLLFLRATREGAIETIGVLGKYCNASGQRINMDKSSVFSSKGCSVALKDGIKEEQRETLQEKYFGMPSDVGSSKYVVLKYLRDKVWKKVLGWLELLLSMGGKEILIKSVAQSVSTFSMSCFKLPRGSASISIRCCGSSGGGVRMEIGK